MDAKTTMSSLMSNVKSFLADVERRFSVDSDVGIDANVDASVKDIGSPTDVRRHVHVDASHGPMTPEKLQRLLDQMKADNPKDNSEKPNKGLNIIDWMKNEQTKLQVDYSFIFMRHLTKILIKCLFI